MEIWGWEKESERFRLYKGGRDQGKTKETNHFGALNS